MDKKSNKVLRQIEYEVNSLRNSKDYESFRLSCELSPDEDKKLSEVESILKHSDFNSRRKIEEINRILKKKPDLKDSYYSFCLSSYSTGKLNNLIEIVESYINKMEDKIEKEFVVNKISGKTIEKSYQSHKKHKMITNTHDRGFGL